MILEEFVVYMAPAGKVGQVMSSAFSRNSPGGWFVVGQFFLFGLIAFGPRTVAGFPDWNPFWCMVGSVAGGLMLVAGTVLALVAVFKHGRNLTPFICPKAGSVLLEQGPYRLMRHPIYTGLMLMGIGWALLVHGWLTLAYAALLFVLLDRKSRREEKWLELRFPGYPAYRQKVRRFFPFIY